MDASSNVREARREHACNVCVQVQNGQQICFLLKKEELGGAAKGSITLVLEVIYNKVKKGPPPPTTDALCYVFFDKRSLSGMSFDLFDGRRSEPGSEPSKPKRRT